MLTSALAAINIAGFEISSKELLAVAIVAVLVIILVAFLISRSRKMPG